MPPQIISPPDYTSGTVSGTTFTKQDWIDAGSPTSFEIRGYETIGNSASSAFQNEHTITDVIFGPGVVSFGSSAMWNNDELVSVTIGPDMTTMDSGVVGVAPKFTTINLDSSNTTFHLDNGILYKKNGTNNIHTLVQYPVGRPAEEFTIPDGVVIIGKYATYTSNITAVHIPASVTNIYNWAFWGQFITSVTFVAGSQLTTIGSEAFKGTAITSIAIPASVTSINQYAFNNTTVLSTIYIADGQVINGSAITSNTTVTDPYGHSGDVFFASTISHPIISPPDYTSGTVPGTTFITQNWIDAGSPTSFEIRGYETIWHNQFNNKHTITDVIFGPGVVALDGTPFWDNDELVSVTIGPDVTTINRGFVGLAPKFTTINLDSSNTTFHLDNGILYKKNGANNIHTLVQYPVGRPAEVFTIHDGVVIIAGASAATTNITEVHIPASVTSVGIDSFSYSSNLTSVTFTTDSQLTTIGSQAFSGNAIASIVIPASVTVISPRAFRSNEDLVTITVEPGNLNFHSANNILYKKVGSNNIHTLLQYPLGKPAEAFTIPDGVEIIEHSAVMESNITAVHIPASVTEIRDRAFDYSGQLATVTFAANIQLTTITHRSFSGTNITSIAIPASVTSIDHYAFSQTPALSTIRIADGQTINGSAITSNTTVTDPYGHSGDVFFAPIISHPDYTSGTVSGTTFTKQDWIDAGSPTSFEIRGYETIGTNIFEGEHTITDVIFGPGVVALIVNPFWSTNGLVSVTIGPDVTTINRGFVGYASNFTTINLDSSNTTFHLDNGILYKKNGANNIHTLVQYPVGRPAEEFTIPDGVVIIADNFAATTNITAVHIPASVTSVGQDSFAISPNLTSVMFAAGSQLTTIGLQAFYDNAITSITIPASVTTIENNAFRDTTSLTIIYIADGQEINGSEITSNTTVTDPYGHSGDVWFLTEDNKDRGPFIDNGVTYSYAYITATTIKITGATNASGNIIIPATFTGTGSIPVTITEIGQNVFSNNTSITSVEIPASVTSIGSTAFNGTTALTIIYIADGQTINGSAITSNTLVTNPYGHSGDVWFITDDRGPFIDNDVTYSYAYITTTTIRITGATNASGSIVIPETFTGTGSTPVTITEIGSSAFSNNTSITSVDIPASVTFIWHGAFYLCANLASVTFATGSALGIIGHSAFQETAITSIAIPASVTYIGIAVFYLCANLAYVTFAAGSLLETIETAAFQDTGTTSIHIPATVTEIGDGAFYMCASLAYVTFAAGSELETIGDQAFYGSGLRSIEIPTSVTSMGFNVFGATPATICFPAGTPVLTDQGEVDIDKIDPEKHTINANKIEGITETTSIENYVVMIEKHAFSEHVPSRDTVISANHKIMFNNHMVQARELLDKSEFNETIYKMDYTGETLYNVLLENKHCVMVVNNLIAETLSPTSVNAWLFRKLKSDISNAERKEVMDAYMQRVFSAPVLSSFMVGCK